MELDSIARACGNSRGYLETISDAAVKPSPIHGHGLFSEVTLPPGTLLCRLDGQHVALEDAPGALNALEWNAVSSTVLLVRPIRTSYGFINHFRTPNVRIHPQTMELVTLAAIPKGTELLLDYLEQPLPDAYLDHPHAEYLRR